MLEPEYPTQTFSKEFKDINPLIFDGVSDSAAFDNALEYLIIGGYDIEEAMMLLIPEAWEKNEHHPNTLNSYYNYFSNFIEPWDGPAAMCFTDGKKLVQFLIETAYVHQDILSLMMAQFFFLLKWECCQLILHQLKKGGTQPGKIFLIDLIEKNIVGNDEIKTKYSSKFKYESHLKKSNFPQRYCFKRKVKTINADDIKKYQVGFGYTKEDLNFFISPMFKDGVEPIGSMGTDTPISLLCDR